MVSPYSQKGGVSQTFPIQDVAFLQEALILQEINIFKDTHTDFLLNRDDAYFNIASDIPPGNFPLYPVI